MKKKISKKTVAVIVLVVAVLAVIIIAGGRKKKPLDDTVAVFSVRTARVVRQDLHVYIETNGNIEPARSIDVYPDVAGKLVQMSVSLGSRVRKNQILGYIDPSVPGSNYVKSPVIAPISGSISSMPLETGTTVSVSTSVAVIGDITNLQISADIPERYVAQLKPGLKAEAALEAYPGEKFAATVIRVSPVVDETSRTKEIYLAFDKEDSRINAGMFAKIKLYTTVAENCLTVPEAAVTTNYDDHFVFVVNPDNTVTQKDVTKGITVDGITQISTGVSENDTIVIEGMQVLSDKSAVRDINAPKPAKNETETDKPKESFFKKLFGKKSDDSSQKESE